MISIDKSKGFQLITLTLTELSDGVGAYKLNLVADGNRGEYSFALPTSISTFPERFDLFKIETSVFSEISDGFYNYSVIQNDVVLEMGKAHVNSPSEPSEIVLQPNSSTNKILIYGE